MNSRPLDRLAIAVAQLNPIVGDVAGNADKVRRARKQAAGEGAEARRSRILASVIASTQSSAASTSPSFVWK